MVRWKCGPFISLKLRLEIWAVSDLAWIDTALTAARPQAVAALLRYFRNLDTAEEAFQEAGLRALQKWPMNGPPRDPAAWRTDASCGV